MDNEGNWSNMLFYAANETSLPFHTAVFRADVGPVLGASANVEQVFSSRWVSHCKIVAMCSLYLIEHLQAIEVGGGVVL